MSHYDYSSSGAQETMQLLELVDEVLTTGELPMNLERYMNGLLAQHEFNETEIAAIDQLIDALCRGTIRSVPDRVG
jgi:hypothetical protein